MTQYKFSDKKLIIPSQQHQFKFVSFPFSPVVRRGIHHPLHHHHHGAQLVGHPTNVRLMLLLMVVAVRWWWHVRSSVCL